MLKAKKNWKKVQLANWNETTKSNIKGKSATDGSIKIALDSNKKENSLTQTISTIEGGEYTFSVDAYSSKKNIGSSDFEMIVDGKVVGTFSPTTEWKTYSVTFEGNGQEQSVGFREVASQNNNKGVFLDNAQLSVEAPVATLDLAKSYGVATQGSTPSYAYPEHKAEMGIDGDKASYIYTNSGDNAWYQVAIPKGSTVSKLMVQSLSFSRCKGLSLQYSLQWNSR